MFREVITEPQRKCEDFCADVTQTSWLDWDSKRHRRVQHRKVTRRQETVSLPPFKAARPRLCLPGRSRLRDADPILPPGQARRASGPGQRSRCSLGLQGRGCNNEATEKQPGFPPSPGGPSAPAPLDRGRRPGPAPSTSPGSAGPPGSPPSASAGGATDPSPLCRPTTGSPGPGSGTRRSLPAGGRLAKPLVFV